MRPSPSPSARLRAGAVLEVMAERLADSGAGVAQYGQAAVHVADLLPGERAEVQVDHVSPHGRRQAWAHIVTRLGAPATQRVAPPCPAFGRCGGCRWQHLAYAEQLVHKRERLVRAFAAQKAVAAVAIAPAIGAAEVCHYRSVGKYVAERVDGASPLRLGSYAPRSHRVIDGAGCQVVTPTIERVRELATRALAPLSVYDERARTGWLRYLILREGADQQVLVTVVTTGAADPAVMRQAADELATEPAVIGVYWQRNDSRGGALLAGSGAPLWGRATVPERVTEVEIALGPGDFFQVNREQAQRLYHEVAGLVLARNPERVVDVYCGVGGIAFAVARAAQRAGHRCQVLGIERNAAAIAAAREAANASGLDADMSFQATDAAHLETAVGTWRAQLSGPGESASGSAGTSELIVVNPPRKGLSPATATALAALRPRHVVYVSCGPDSLARDVAELCRRADYQVTAVQPIDLMPGTPQIETVVALTRP